MSTRGHKGRARIVRVSTGDAAGSTEYPVIIGRKLGITDQIAGRVAILFHDGAVRPPNAPGAIITKLPRGENSKTFQIYRRVLDAMIRADSGRPIVAIACGGGAVGDLVGFAAATYRRGIPFIQVPTTLLAMVDASVGGKTAINHPLAKNMIGAFHQPECVIADLDRLKTLPSRQLRSGLAEVIKHGLIADARLFDAIARDAALYLDPTSDVLADAVRRSVEIKASVVKRDTRETKGIREWLNFGHTTAHAIEAVREFRGITHGEAVAIGMVAASRVSERLLGFRDTQQVEEAVAGAGLPSRLRGESARKLIEATRRDKKRRGAALRMTLLEKKGRAVVRDGIPERLLAEVLRELGASA